MIHVKEKTIDYYNQNADSFAAGTVVSNGKLSAA